MRWLLAPFLLTATAAAAEPQWSPDALDGFDWGIICVAEAGERVAAPGTIAGFIEIYAGDPVIGLRTLRLPALPELAFGVLLTGDADGAAVVEVTVTHPPMQPLGRTEQSWTTSIPAGATTASFFRFDTAEERVPGQWRFTAREGGQVIYDIAFEVLDPALMSGFADPCPGPAPLS